MSWRRQGRQKPDPADEPLDCAAVAARLQEHLDQELTDDLAVRINAHLEACNKCGLEAETYSAIKSSIGRCQHPGEAAMGRLANFADQIAGTDAPPS